LHRLRRCAALVFAALVGISAIAAERRPPPPDLARALSTASALMREGRAEEAWQLLSSREPEYAGRQDFDYQLAVAALGSGRENLATFVLERILAADPGHAGARLELGRALFALGDFERAQSEFDAVLAAGPPPAIRAAVLGYQARMRRADAEARAPVGGYVEVSLGRDTNVNAASSQGSVFVPALGTDFVPPGAFQRQGDSFAALAAGVEGSRALHGGSSLLAAADIKLRRHTDLQVFDSQVVDLHGAVRLPVGARDSLRLGVSHHEFRLDDHGYRRMQSASGQWSRLLREPTRVSVLAQASRIRYLREDVRSSSSNLAVLGVGAAHALPAAGTLSGSLHAGFDKAVAEREDGDRVLRGASIGWQKSRLFGLGEAFAAASYLRSDYRRENASFGELRRDRQTEAVVGLAWRLAGAWQLRPQIAHTDNRSNLELNDYHRTELSLSLRRVWD
jgi:outer membrane protein